MRKNYHSKAIVFYIFILSLLSGTLYSQPGGKGTYDFLNAAVPARIAALGGTSLVSDDHDIQLSLFNPSLISPEMHQQLSLAYVDYFADIRFSSIQYGRTFERFGSFTASLQYHNYGRFDYADEAGNRDGTFGASDYALMFGWGRQLDSNFSIGAQAKLVGSQYESYSSYGLAVDVAGTYRNAEGWLFSLVARNIGSELKSYIPGYASSMPFTMQLSVSKRLDHVPFRLMLVYDNLQKWDLTYDDPLDLKGRIDPITGKKNELKGVEKYADQFMRHLVFGGEFYMGKNLTLRGSYNYKRRQEMQIPDKLAMVGFGWGIGIRVNRFNINYSRSSFHVVGSPNYFTVTTNLDSFR